MGRIAWALAVVGVALPAWPQEGARVVVRRDFVGDGEDRVVVAGSDITVRRDTEVVVVPSENPPLATGAGGRRPMTREDLVSRDAWT